MLEKFREFCRVEGAKLKEMGFRDKLGYIWEYYKIPIIIAVVVVFIAGSIIDTVWLHPPKRPFVQFAFLEGYQSEEALESLAQTVTAGVMTEEEQLALEVLGTAFLNNTGDPQMDMANSQKLFAMIAARELDFLILPQESLDAMAEQGMFADLAPYLSASAKERLKDALVYAKVEDATILCAISVGAIPAFGEGFSVEGQVAGIAASAERLDNIQRVLDFLLNQ
jgi:hypothetical protein